MKQVLVAALMLGLMLTLEQETLAVVSMGATADSGPRDAVVTGNFGGYTIGMIYIVGADGVRIGYPFEPNRELLKAMSRYHLKKPLRLFIHGGHAVRIEEVH